MKQIILISTFILLSTTIFAQSLSPTILATSGDYQQSTNYTLSWTLGELSTESFSSTNTILTQGFQQPVNLSISGVDMHIITFLEGSYLGGNTMTTSLNSKSLLPLSQPFNIYPWYYSGTESVGVIPNSDIVDWILVELRDAPSPNAASPSTTIAQKAAFLLKNGQIVSFDGSSILQFDNLSLNHNLYLVLWHRNHLGVLSANPLIHTGNSYSYDFSTALTQVYNGSQGYKEIETGIFGMVGGDANNDGKIDESDRNLWSDNVGTQGYQNTDFKLDGEVNNQDKDDIYHKNTSYTNQVPQ